MLAAKSGKSEKDILAEEAAKAKLNVSDALGMQLHFYFPESPSNRVSALLHPSIVPTENGTNRAGCIHLSRSCKGLKKQAGQMHLQLLRILGH